MRETFYIFLDIDGVLNDYEFLMRVRKEDPQNCWSKFNPKSVEALNYLINRLDKKYDVELVISSSWRINLKRTLSRLEANGVDFSSLANLGYTNFINGDRELEILQYLNEKNEEKNFVIIDDELFGYADYNLDKYLIKTDMMGITLTRELVDEYFDRFEHKM